MKPSLKHSRFGLRTILHPMLTGLHPVTPDPDNATANRTNQPSEHSSTRFGTTDPMEHPFTMMPWTSGRHMVPLWSLPVRGPFSPHGVTRVETPLTETVPVTYPVSPVMLVSKALRIMLFTTRTCDPFTSAPDNLSEPEIYWGGSIMLACAAVQHICTFKSEGHTRQIPQTAVAGSILTAGWPR